MGRTEAFLYHTKEQAQFRGVGDLGLCVKRRERMMESFFFTLSLSLSLSLSLYVFRVSRRPCPAFGLVYFFPPSPSSLYFVSAISEEALLCMFQGESLRTAISLAFTLFVFFFKKTAFNIRASSAALNGGRPCRALYACKSCLQRV